MPGVFSENLNMTVKFLTRKDENYIYAATPMLMTRSDLFPCDKDGNIVGVNAPVAAGIHPILPDVNLDAKLQNIALALGAPLDVVQQMAEGKSVNEISPPQIEADAEVVEKAAGISPPADESPPPIDPADLQLQPAPGPETPEPSVETTEDDETKETPFVFDPEATWSTYNREDMCAWALAKHGDLAASIDPEWSRKDIMVAIETLEAPPEAPPPE